MFILIDLDNLRMIAAANKRSHMELVEYEFPNVETLVVNCHDGGSWTGLSREQMSTLFTNMSGQTAPDYGDAIEQLRAYGATWPDYPISEEELRAKHSVDADGLEVEETEDGDIEGTEDEEPYVAPEDEIPEDDPVQQAILARKAERMAHQAAIAAVEAATPSTEPRAAAEKPATKPKKASVIPSRSGSTKRIWDIGDLIYAEHEKAGGEISLKAVRAKIMELAAAEGINAGTAATQYGKWKAERGYK